MTIEDIKSKWKISAQTLTIVYIILICMGYTEKSIFYDKFDINIAPYLNFEEYLFIFLPIGAAFVTVFFILSTYFAGLIGAGKVLLGGGNITQNKVPTNIEEKNLKKESTERTKTQKIRTILAIVLFFIIALPPIIVLLYYGITKSYNDRVFGLISIIWGLIMVLLMFYQSLKKEDISISLLIYAFIMAFLIPLLWSQKIDSAKRVLAGKSEFKVSFEKKNKKISTNDTIIFIGQTKEYLFIRNLNDNSNIIYKKENIDEMKMTKKTFANNGYKP